MRRVGPQHLRQQVAQQRLQRRAQQCARGARQRRPNLPRPARRDGRPADGSLAPFRRPPRALSRGAV